MHHWAQLVEGLRNSPLFLVLKNTLVTQQIKADHTLPWVHLCHSLTLWSIWDILFSSPSLVFGTFNQLGATGKQKANSEPQISSSCPRWENKWLFSWATLPYLFSSLALLHLSIPRSCGFFITGLLSSRACSLLLALTLTSLSSFFLPSSVCWL